MRKHEENCNTNTLTKYNKVHKHSVRVTFIS